MKNKKEKHVSQQKGKQMPVPPVAEGGISTTGKKVIAAGIVLLIAGFYILTKTDPMGQNWASTLSPFLILGGYAAIGIGIILPDRKPGEVAQAGQPSR